MSTSSENGADDTPTPSSCLNGVDDASSHESEADDALSRKSGDDNALSRVSGADDALSRKSRARASSHESGADDASTRPKRGVEETRRSTRGMSDSQQPEIDQNGQNENDNYLLRNCEEELNQLTQEMSGSQQPTNDRSNEENTSPQGCVEELRRLTREMSDSNRRRSKLLAKAKKIKQVRRMLEQVERKVGRDMEHLFGLVEEMPDGEDGSKAECKVSQMARKMKIMSAR